jgi:hypothetical protein
MENYPINLFEERFISKCAHTADAHTLGPRNTSHPASLPRMGQSLATTKNLSRNSKATYPEQ